MQSLRTHYSRRVLLGVLTVSGGVLQAACSTNVAPSVKPVAAAMPTATPAPDSGPGVLTFQAPAATRVVDHLELPLRLAIPKLKVDAPIIAVGLTAEGAMDVPRRADEVGWYEFGTRPGMKGNAVLAGHLDWYGADGVFRRLADLNGGDTVVIRAANGDERPYGVEWKQEYAVGNAPMAKVFEWQTSAALTLITCGGRWNAAARLYETRIVVRCQRKV